MFRLRFTCRFCSAIIAIENHRASTVNCHVHLADSRIRFFFPFFFTEIGFIRYSISICELVRFQLPTKHIKIIHCIRSTFCARCVIFVTKNNSNEKWLGNDLETKIYKSFGDFILFFFLYILAFVINQEKDVHFRQNLWRNVIKTIKITLRMQSNKANRIEKRKKRRRRRETENIPHDNQVVFFFSVNTCKPKNDNEIVRRTKRAKTKEKRRKKLNENRKWRKIFSSVEDGWTCYMLLNKCMIRTGIP